jgi:hypothetical protein
MVVDDLVLSFDTFSLQLRLRPELPPPSMHRSRTSLPVSSARSVGLRLAGPLLALPVPGLRPCLLRRLAAAMPSGGLRLLVLVW